MFEKIDVFQMARAMASHAAFRQNAINQNIANADTPGYAARDVDSFSETYGSSDAPALRATRSGHIGADLTTRAEMTVRLNAGTASPDGNNVSIEDEMVKAVEVKRQHDLALSIYKSSLNIMRASLGR